MSLLSENNTGYLYLHDSTAASVSTGSYSSAIESFALGNAFWVVDLIQEVSLQAQDYAIISKTDRQRMKIAYPKPNIAKTPALSKELDVM